MQKFYCDNCGTMVKKDSSRCPKCGRYFRSVKCPQCGFAGSPDLFSNGCPSCGYAAENIAYEFDLYPKHEKKKFGFSETFYRRIIPALLIVFIFLLVMLARILI